MKLFFVIFFWKIDSFCLQAPHVPVANKFSRFQVIICAHLQATGYLHQVLLQTSVTNTCSSLRKSLKEDTMNEHDPAGMSLSIISRFIKTLSDFRPCFGCINKGLRFSEAKVDGVSFEIRFPSDLSHSAVITALLSFDFKRSHASFPNVLDESNNKIKRCWSAMVFLMDWTHPGQQELRYDDILQCSFELRHASHYQILRDLRPIFSLRHRFFCLS